MDWDDLRFVLAVAREGSALRAARSLKVNQTTVMRRIAHIEADVGADLFDSKQSGQVLTPLGQCVAAAAERIESEVAVLQSTIAAQQRMLCGSVRFTSPDVIANQLVAPCLRTFRKQYPGVTVELIVDDRRLDLARNEADVAMRAGSRPQGAGIVAQRLPNAAWGVYCSHAYVEDHGVPKHPDELCEHAIVGLDGIMASLPISQWLTRMAPNSSVSARSNSLTNLISALKAGLGVGPLPCFVGDAESELVRCFPPVRELDSEIWLITREDLKHTLHVRAFVDFLAAHVHGMRARMAGADVRPQPARRAP
jgi:DNA-binding transcriptional LysR family regulator